MFTPPDPTRENHWGAYRFGTHHLYGQDWFVHGNFNGSSSGDKVVSFRQTEGNTVILVNSRGEVTVRSPAATFEVDPTIVADFVEKACSLAQGARDEQVLERDHAVALRENVRYDVLVGIGVKPGGNWG